LLLNIELNQIRSYISLYINCNSLQFLLIFFNENKNIVRQIIKHSIIKQFLCIE